MRTEISKRAPHTITTRLPRAYTHAYCAGYRPHIPEHHSNGLHCAYSPNPPRRGLADIVTRELGPDMPHHHREGLPRAYHHGYRAPCRAPLQHFRASPRWTSSRIAYHYTEARPRRYYHTGARPRLSHHHREGRPRAFSHGYRPGVPLQHFREPPRGAASRDSYQHAEARPRRY